MSQQVPEFGGCPWPADFAQHQEKWDAYAPDVQVRALAMATVTLERLVAYRVRNCPITVRPCADGPAVAPAAYFTGYAGPTNWGGRWSNGGCGGVSCVASCEVRLPGPVHDPITVKVDGETLDRADFRVDNESILVWRGAGPCPFPATQNLSLDDTEVGTFSVTYLNAYPVDAVGAYAAGLLALEFAKAMTGDTKCSIPKNVTSLVRNGVAMEILSGSFPNGMTNIREVDAFIGAWNPKRRTAPSVVWSPDVPLTRVQGS